MSTESPELNVSALLRRFESDLRRLALLALADWSAAVERDGGTRLVRRELVTPVRLLEHPSYGVWRRLLEALRAAWRATKDDPALAQAGTLRTIVTALEAPLPSSVSRELDHLARLGKQSLGKSPRLAQALALPVGLRNVGAHFAPKPGWWVEAASALEPLRRHLDALGPLCPEARTCTPWFIERDGKVLDYAGLASSSGHPIYAGEGEVVEDPDQLPALGAALGGVLGKQLLRDELAKLLSLPADDEPAGVLLGDYLVGERVGKGGFATVHDGRHVPTGRRVAIKLLHAKNLPEDARAWFMQEAELLARFHHPFIVQVFDVGEGAWEDPDRQMASRLAQADWFKELKSEPAWRSYLVLEWIDGPTLQQLGERDLPPHLGELPRAVREPDQTTKARWFGEAADALATTHSAGIVHRDVKPGNLMVGSDDHLRLTDYGIARERERDRGLQTVSGGHLTPAFMSPEQARVSDVQVAVGPASDVYSLCASFYYVFAGSLPPPVDSDERVTACPEAGAILEQVLLGGLERHPATRYPSGKELAEDLRRVAENRPILHRPPGAWQRAVLTYRRAPDLWRVVLVSFLIVTCLVTAWIVYLRAARDREARLRADAEQALGREAVAKQAALDREEEAKRAKQAALDREEEAELARGREAKARQDAEAELARSLAYQADALATAERWPEAAGLYRRAEELLRALGRSTAHVDLGLADCERFCPTPIAEVALGSIPPTVLALSSDGRCVVAGDQDGGLRAYDLLTGALLRVLAPGGYEAVALSAGGEAAACVDGGGHLASWSVSPRRAIGAVRLEGEPDSWVAVAVTADGVLAAVSRGDEPGVELWDLKAGRRLRALPDLFAHGLVFTPDGVLLASDPGLVRLAPPAWEPERLLTSGTPVALGGSAAGVLVVTNGGRARLVGGSGSPRELGNAPAGARVGVSPNGRCWAHASSAGIKVLSADTGQVASSNWAEAELASLRVSDDGRALDGLSGDGISTPELWSFGDLGGEPASVELDGETIAAGSLTPGGPLLDDGLDFAVGGAPPLWTAAILTLDTPRGPGRAWVAAGTLDGLLEVWDLDDGRLLRSWSPAEPAPTVHGVTFAEGDELLAAVSVREPVRAGVARLALGAVAPTLRLASSSLALRGPVVLRPLRDGRRVALAFQGGAAIYRLDSATRQRALGEGRAVDVLGRMALLGSDEGQLVRHELESDTVLPPLKAHDVEIVWVETLDDAHVLTGGADGEVKLWDVATWSRPRRFVSAVAPPLSSKVQAFARSHSGEILAAVGWNAQGCCVRAWCLRPRPELEGVVKDSLVSHLVHSRGLVAGVTADTATFLAPDLAAIASREASSLLHKVEGRPVDVAANGSATTLIATIGRMVVELDLRTGRDRTRDACDGPLTAMAIAPDGHCVYVAGKAQLARWTLPLESQPSITLPAPAPVRFLRISPNGEWLAAGLAEDRVWLVPARLDGRGRELEGRAKACTFSPDGALLTIAAGHLTRWDPRGGAPGPGVVLERTGRVVQLTELPSGMVVSGRSGLLSAHGAEGGAPRWTYPPPDADRGDRLSVWAAAQGGVVVVLSSGAVVCLDPTTGVERWRTPGKVLAQEPDSVSITAGGRVLLGCVGELALLDLAGGVPVWRSTAEREIRAVTLAPNLTTAYTGSRNGTILAWDIAEVRPVATIAALETAVHGLWDTAAGLIAWTGEQVLDLPRGAAPRRRELPPGDLAAAWASPTGDLALALMDGRVFRLDRGGGARELGLCPEPCAVAVAGQVVVAASCQGPLVVFDGAAAVTLDAKGANADTRLALSVDGALLTTWTNTERKFVLWDVRGSRRLRTFDRPTKIGAAVFSDEALLLSDWDGLWSFDLTASSADGAALAALADSRAQLAVDLAARARASRALWRLGAPGLAATLGAPEREEVDARLLALATSWRARSTPEQGARPTRRSAHRELSRTELEEDPIPWTHAVQDLVRSGRHAEAAEEAERLVTKFPDSAHARVARAQARHVTKAYAGALQDLDVALDGRALDAEVERFSRVLRAEALLRLRRAKEAIAEASRVLEGAPEDADALYVRGRARLELAEAAGVEDLERFIELRPESSRSAEAAAVVRELSPGRMAQSLLGALGAATAEDEVAELELRARSLVRHRPESGLAWAVLAAVTNRRAWLQLRAQPGSDAWRDGLRRREEALAWGRDGVARASQEELPLARQLQGELLLAAGASLDAVAALRSATDPAGRRSYPAERYLADAAANAGLYEEALQALGRAVPLAPEGDQPQLRAQLRAAGLVRDAQACAPALPCLVVQESRTASLEAGDVLFSFDGTPVPPLDPARWQRGGEVVVVRAGQRRTVSLPPGSVVQTSFAAGARAIQFVACLPLNPLGGLKWGDRVESVDGAALGPTANLTEVGSAPGRHTLVLLRHRVDATGCWLVLPGAGPPAWDLERVTVVLNGPLPPTAALFRLVESEPERRP